MKKFDLIQLKPEGSDCTAPYKVKFYQPCTVKEFIDEVLRDKREWGTIYIAKDANTFLGSTSCEYKCGELKTTLPEEYLSLTIISAKSTGGWSLMDYSLWVNRPDLFGDSRVSGETVYGEFFKATDHFGYRLESGPDGIKHVVYKNDEVVVGKHIAKFDRKFLALNECRYLEKYQ